MGVFDFDLMVLTAGNGLEERFEELFVGLLERPVGVTVDEISDGKNRVNLWRQGVKVAVLDICAWLTPKQLEEFVLPVVERLKSRC